MWICERCGKPTKEDEPFNSVCSQCWTDEDQDELEQHEAEREHDKRMALLDDYGDWKREQMRDRYDD